MVPCTSRRRTETQRAHGEGVTFLAADWEFLITQFKQVHGVAIDETRLPSMHDWMRPSRKLHDESFKESVHDGQLKADTLACRISAKRRDPDQQASRPTEAVGHHVRRQSNEGYRHASATCLQRWQTSRNFATNGVMTHLRLLAQIRQPGPDLCADLSPATFRTFLVEVWSEDNFSMNR